jgi:hypothetical protein
MKFTYYWRRTRTFRAYIFYCKYIRVNTPTQIKFSALWKKCIRTPELENTFGTELILMQGFFFNYCHKKVHKIFSFDSIAVDQNHAW